MTEIPWQRRWVPLGAEPAAWIDGEGWAHETVWLDHTEGPAAPRRLRAVRERCVFLIGEAGAGKSVELRALGQATGAPPVDLVAEWVEVREALRREGAASVGGPALLDRLDEAPDAASKLASLWQHLGNLRRAHPDRPLPPLRIACRSTRWPQFRASSEEAAELFGSGDVAVLTLLPLRRSEAERGVSEWAQVDDPTAKNRVRAWGGPGLVSIARWPLGLKLLCAADDSDGASRRTLFDQALPKLALPPGRRVGDALDADARITIAERFAVASVLMGRQAVGDADAGLKLRELAGADWGVQPGGLSPTVEQVRETIRDSALFSSCGDGWAFEHEELRAFLAARYLDSLDLSLLEVLRLLGPRDGEPGVILGHLAPVASWLVELQPGVASLIAKHDPIVLLHDAHPNLSEAARATVVSAVLAGLGAAFSPWEIARLRGVGNLAHEGLAAQLAPLLAVGSSRDRQVGACLIAQRCAVSGAVAALLALALDPTADETARSVAVRVVARLGGVAAREQLLPLCGSESPERLRGRAIAELWPTQVDTATMLEGVGAGAEHGLVYDLAKQRIAKELPREDLAAALDWADAALDQLPVYSLRRWIAEAILRRALVGAELPQDRRRAAVLPWLGPRLPADCLWQSVHWDFWSEEEERALLDALLDAARSLGAPSGTDDASRSARRAFQRPGLLDRRVEQLIERARDAPDPTEREWCLWAARCSVQRLVREREGSDEPRAEVERRWEAVQRLAADPMVVDAIGDLLVRDSSLAKKSGRPRRRFEPESAEWRRAVEQGAAHLRQLAAERSAMRWPDIAWVLQTWPEAREGALAGVGDIPQRLLWTSLSDSDQRAIAVLARDWLAATRPAPPDGTRPSPTGEENAGFWALGLLASLPAKERPVIAAEVWESWAPNLLGATVWTGCEGNLVDIVRDAASVALPTLCEALGSVLVISGTHALFAWDRVERALTLPGVADAAAEVVGALLAADRLPEVQEAFRRLLQAGSGRALAVGLAFVEQHGDQDKAIAVAAALLEKRPQDAWETLRSLSPDDDERQRRLLRRVAEVLGRDVWSPEQSLASEQVGALFEWLARLFPYEADPEREGGEQDWEVRRWRDRILVELRGRTDGAALEAARRLRDALPSLSWLARVVEDLTRAVRAADHVPLSLEEVRALGRRRPIRNAGDLLAAVDLALKDAQSALQNKPTPRAEELWNEALPPTATTALGEGRESESLRAARSPKAPRTPKREVALSEWLVSYLRDRTADRFPGATVVLDSEEKKADPGGDGQRPDIQIVLPVGACHLRCIIEVKPLWAELIAQLPVKAAYQAQTIDTRTIYLVFWFALQQWDAKDSRRRKALRWSSLEALKARLEHEAAALPADRRLEIRVLDGSF